MPRFESSGTANGTVNAYLLCNKIREWGKGAPASEEKRAECKVSVCYVARNEYCGRRSSRRLEGVMRVGLCPGYKAVSAGAGDSEREMWSCGFDVNGVIGDESVTRRRYASGPSHAMIITKVPVAQS